MVYHRIRYFLKAADLGSFSNAAKQLYISPQALTKQIGLLEEELGGKLFERTTRGVVLTEFGKYAQKVLFKVNYDLEETLRDLKSKAVTGKKQLRIGIFSALPQESFIIPLISFLMGTFTEYQVNLSLMGLREGREAIQNNLIDLLITNTHEEDAWEGCTCYSFKKTEAKIIVSLLHPWFIKEKITIDEMKKNIFLKMDMGTESYVVPKGHGFYDRIPCASVQKVDNFATMFAVLQQGDTFSIFPPEFAQIPQTKIKCFDIPERKFYYHTALLAAENSRLPEIHEIVAEIQEEFELTRL